MKPHLEPTAARVLLRRGDAAWALLLGAFAVAATFDAWRDIYRVALADEECNYVLLAPLVIGWLAWGRRGRLAACPALGGWVGVLLVLGSWMVFRLGYVADPVIWRAGAVGILAAALMAAVGSSAAARLAPVFLAMLFLIPIDPNGRYRLAEPLQIVTSHATQSVCDLFGIDVERAGSLLTINGIGVAVAEACNGMRMMLALFMVCYVVVFSRPMRPLPRLLLLSGSPVVAVICNVIRLAPTVWMFGHCSRNAAERFHAVSGWAMTIMAFFVLMGFRRMIQPKPTRLPSPVAAVGSPPALAALTLTRKECSRAI